HSLPRSLSLTLALSLCVTFSPCHLLSTTSTSNRLNKYSWKYGVTLCVCVCVCVRARVLDSVALTQTLFHQRKRGNKSERLFWDCIIQASKGIDLTCGRVVLLENGDEADMLAFCRCFTLMCVCALRSCVCGL